jgi:hypothetical protein
VKTQVQQTATKLPLHTKNGGEGALIAESPIKSCSTIYSISNPNHEQEEADNCKFICFKKIVGLNTVQYVVEDFIFGTEMYLSFNGCSSL